MGGDSRPKSAGFTDDGDRSGDRDAAAAPADRRLFGRRETPQIERVMVNPQKERTADGRRLSAKVRRQ